MRQSSPRNAREKTSQNIILAQMASKQKSQNFLEGAKQSIVPEETDESQESVKNPLSVEDIDSGTSGD